ncbi:MAG: hypothetical protein GX230_05550 [Lentisphaerae bacterium]|jgi:Tfp pilus assembly protein PilN|nr:hypothetical protein [Lentisphaerota bacterium]
MADFVRVLRNIVIAVAVIVAICGSVLILAPRIRELRDRDMHSKQLMSKIDSKQQEIKEIRAKQQRLHADPSFVERVARENRRIRPSEVVFTYEPEQ